MIKIAARRFLSRSSFLLQSQKFFTKDHEWVQVSSNNTLRVGITKHAADNLGEITYLGLDELQEFIDDEEVINAGDTLCEIESVKSAATIGAPVTGIVLKINENLGEEDGKLMNADPEGEGFLCEMKKSDDDDVSFDEMMDENSYKNYLEASK